MAVSSFELFCELAIKSFLMILMALTVAHLLRRAPASLRCFCSTRRDVPGACDRSRAGSGTLAGPWVEHAQPDRAPTRSRRAGDDDPDPPALVRHGGLRFHRRSARLAP